MLTQGISKQTGLPFGLITNLVGVLVLLLWIPIRQKPGVGTVLNVLLIGPSAQLVLWLVPEQTELWVRIPLFVAGLLVVGIATGLYIGARLGPGPRDGLMTGLHAKIGWPIWLVRTLIEVTVLAIGWVLGGNVGIGTVAFALLIGPIANVTLPLLRVPSVPPCRPDGRDGRRRWRRGEAQKWASLQAPARGGGGPMIVIFSLAVIVLWASVATVVLTSRDGYRRIPTADYAV